MTAGDLTAKIGESAGLKPKDVKAVLAALTAIATAEVKKTEKFVIPQVCMLKLKHKPARKAGKKMMFGKEVKRFCIPDLALTPFTARMRLRVRVRVLINRGTS